MLLFRDLEARKACICLTWYTPAAITKAGEWVFQNSWNPKTSISGHDLHFPSHDPESDQKNAGLEHYAEFKHVFGKILELSIATLLLVDALIEIVLTASEKPNKKKNYAY